MSVNDALRSRLKTRNLLRALGWALLALAVAWLAYLLFFPLSDRLAQAAYAGRDAKVAADAVASARGLVATVLGATAALGGIYLTWANQNRTQRESLRSQALSRQTLDLAREARVSENFIKAVDQLGGANPATRVGGIFGLGRLLRSAEVDGDYWPIMDVLNFFVRNWSRGFDRNQAKREPPEDIQAALTVIARRGLASPPREGDAPVDLHDCFLKGAYLSHAKLQTAWLESVDLTDATLKGADLYRAWLKNAKLVGARLVAAKLVETELEGADLTGCDLTDAELRGCRFKRSDLRGAAVTQAQLDTAQGDRATHLPAGLQRPAHWR